MKARKPESSGCPGELSQRFGRDFGGVRVHSDPEAAESTRAVNAFSVHGVGGHIVFGADQYAPHTVAGRKLLAHELAHVMQQHPGTLTRQTNPSAVDTSNAQSNKTDTSASTQTDSTGSTPTSSLHAQLAQLDSLAAAGGVCSGFFKEFKFCMDGIGLPVPTTLFQDVASAVASGKAIAAAIKLGEISR